MSHIFATRYRTFLVLILLSPVVLGILVWWRGKDLFRTFEENLLAIISLVATSILLNTGRTRDPNDVQGNIDAIHRSSLWLIGTIFVLFIAAGCLPTKKPSTDGYWINGTLTFIACLAIYVRLILPLKTEVAALGREIQEMKEESKKKP